MLLGPTTGRPDQLVGGMAGSGDVWGGASVVLRISPAVRRRNQRLMSTPFDVMRDIEAG